MLKQNLICSLRSPKLSDKEPFLRLVKRSESLHSDWVHPPSTPEAFDNYIERLSQNSLVYISYFLCDHNGDIIGVFNISEIVRGCFQSGYLGYYVFAPYAGLGFMSQGLKLVCEQAFILAGLHRLEANIQPHNQASINLVKSQGFFHEGFSKRYLKIDGIWQDHERWALTYEDWLLNLEH